MKKICFALITLVTILNSVVSQTAPGKYWIQFTDKNNSPFSINNPSAFLSQKAIERRSNFNIPIKFNDLPVNPFYIDSVTNLGATVLTKSKWFNSLTISCNDTIFNQIIELPFVADYQKIAPEKLFPYNIQDKFISSCTKFKTIRQSKDLLSYGESGNQIEMLHGNILHNSGFQGQGKIIAILDAGFFHVDTNPGFDSLWSNNQILGTRDFVENDTMVFDAHPHGMQVLSVMAANVPGTIVGAAPKASYWLIRTEDTGSEYRIEEDNWVSGAEFADSVGADIINTSLGYSTFSDPIQNHSFTEMDGNTTRISIAADIASEKGILVVVSAGNDGTNSWFRIDCPADADSALTVGAVDYAGEYVSFSSKGPSADGQVKPNVAAQGLESAILNNSGESSLGSGTSFAAPLVAGLSACLWQANPQFSNIELLHAIEVNCSHYLNPDSLTGYGIPNFAQANLYLHGIDYEDFENDNLVRTFPNPFSDVLNIEFYSVDTQDINLKMYDISGKLHIDQKYKLGFTSYNRIILNETRILKSGTYIIEILSNKSNYKILVVKM